MEKQAKHEPVMKKSTDNNNSMHPSSQAETNVPRSCRGQSLDKHLRGASENEKNQSPDRKPLVAPVVDSSEKKMQNDDKKKGRL